MTNVDIHQIHDRKILTLMHWGEVYEAVEVAMASVSNGHGKQSIRQATPVVSHQNSILFTMPGSLKDTKFGALAVKLISIFPHNAVLHDSLPALNAIIVLFDETTGLKKALIDATELTLWRTAAASVVATNYIAKNKVLKIAALVGCGNQGKYHALAVDFFYRMDEIRVWNRTTETAEAFVSDMNERCRHKVFKHFVNLEEAVTGADFIITTTHTEKPIIEDPWVKNGAHIVAVGHNPGSSELTLPLYLRSDVYVDSMEGAKHELPFLEAGGVIFRGEIGELISGKLYPPAADKVTIFDSLGMALEDVAVAKLVFDKYMAEKHK